MNRSRVFHDRTEGQSLVIVALSMLLLMGALAFAIDWGYGLTQRRAMSNSAEAGALGAGVLLARSVMATTEGFVFTRSQEETYCEAERAASLDRPFAPAGAVYGVTLEGYADGATEPAWTMTDVACPPASETTLPSETRTLRVVAQVGYRSLIASLVGWPRMVSAGSIRARIVGVPYEPGGHIWPMVRHYSPNDLVQRCDEPCDPLSVEPFTFWSPQGTEPNMVYGNFKGQVDLSKRSSREPDPTVDSLIHRWDMSGSPEGSPPTPPKQDMSGNCKGLWDTIGGDSETEDKQCSIPNWFYYFFEGELSLDSQTETEHPGSEPPTPLGARGTICPVPTWLSAPSCDRQTVGDWVETASGNVGNNNSELMVEVIRRAYDEGFGYTTPYSDLPVPGKQNTVFGKALTVTIYMWDCAETYAGNAPEKERWTLIPGTDGDCSRIAQTGRTPTPDRVHLFTVVPFTFYEGLVETSLIRGYWGGAVGPSDGCPTGDCLLNPLTNTVILRPDE